jgi:methylmalonyl-CoA/ethylmalonyl-CoA epimerase
MTDADRPLVAHVGIAVENLDESIAVYRLLTGDANPHIEEIPERGLKLAMFGGETACVGARIELLSSTSPDSTIGRFLEKHGQGLHHICVFVDDVAAKLAELKERGFRLIDEAPREGAGGTRIAFVHPSGTGGVLLELQERSTTPAS